MKKIFPTIFVVFWCISGFAQSFDFAAKELDQAGNAMFVKLNPQTVAKQTDARLLLKSLLPSRMQQLIEARLVRSFSDSTGAIHDHFNFFYKNIEIVGADYVVHTRNGNIQYANGTLPVSDLNSVKLPASDFPDKFISLAIRRSLEKRNNDKVTFENSEGTFKGLFLLFQNGILHPVYKVEVISRAAVVQDFYYLDTNDGSVVMEGSNICNYADETGTAPLPPPFVAGTAATLYSGTQTITTELTGGQYRLKDMRRTIIPIQTHNANNYYYSDEIIAHATDFFDNDNNWQAGEHPADRAAVDAHWALEQSFDYWYNVHGRNSINDYGMAIDGYVHVSTNEDLAFWDVTYHTLNFGDGGANFTALTALDVVSHEYGHGVCQYTCNLYTGTSFQASSLNEGISDIWGACNEHWAAPSKNPWLSGEEITKVAPFYYRSLSDPLSSKKPQPNTYLGTNWQNPSSDPHINAGVICHWFYLLVNGGSGWNNGQTSHASPGNGYQWTVSGIDWNRAEKIMYRTEQLLSSSADYAQVRTMSIQAARELYGAGSCEEVNVTKAWYAVGVGANWVPGNPVAAPILNGSAIICSSPENYYVNYAYNGTATCGGETVTWSATPANLVNFSCTNCYQTSLTPIGNGYITLKATVTSGAQVQETTKYIKVGAYSNYQVQISGYTLVPLNYGSSYSVNLASYPGLTNLVWSWPSPPSYNPPYAWSLLYNGGSNYIALRSGSAASTGNVSLNFTACGANTIASKWVAWGYGGPSYRISPNPANEVIKVEQLDSVTNKASSANTIQLIEVVDKMGLLVYRKEVAKGTPNGMNIPVATLRSDVYTVRIFDGKEWKSYKVLIKH